MTNTRPDNARNIGLGIKFAGVLLAGLGWAFIPSLTGAAVAAIVGCAVVWLGGLVHDAAEEIHYEDDVLG